MSNKSSIVSTNGLKGKKGQITHSKSSIKKMNNHKKTKTVPTSINNSVISNSVNNTIKSNTVSQVRFKNYESSGLVDPNIRN